MVSLEKKCALSFAFLCILIIFSKFSHSISKAGAHGKSQLSQTCDTVAKKALFFLSVSEQDESMAISLLHACEARAHAMAAKHLADRSGVIVEGVDLLEIIEESEERVESIIGKMQ